MADHTQQPDARSRLTYVLDAGWIDRERAQDRFDRQHQRDKIGHTLHTGLAMLALFMVSWPTSFVELAGVPLAIYCVIRFNNTWRTYWSLIRQPVYLLLLAYALYSLASWVWTADRSLWFKDFGDFRFLGAVLLLWPVIDNRRLLIYALAAGFVFGQLSQVAHALGRAAEIDWLTFNRMPDRNSGWWDPVVGGSLLVSALGLQLAGVLSGGLRTRVVASIASVTLLLSIFATGTRGAWIGAALLIGLSVLLALWRVRPRSRLVRPLAIACVLGAIALGGAWLTVGESIQRRYEAGRDEVRLALSEQNYETDTGARILMWEWAWREFRERPILGVGIGGYRAYAQTDNDEHAHLLHDHAHGVVPHLAATQGLVGLALAGGVLLLALRNGFRLMPEGSLGGYIGGPPLALLGLCCVGLFDTIHTNAQTCAMLGVLIALCPSWLPAPYLGGRCDSSSSTNT